MLRVFAGVLQDSIGQLFDKTKDPARDPVGDAQLFHELALEAELSTEAIVGNAWQNHLLDRILADENAFSQKAQRAPLDAMGSGLVDAVREDLAALRQLFDYPIGPIGLGSFRPLGDQKPPAIKVALAQADDWRGMLEPLAAHYQEHGCGPLARFGAFRWVSDQGSGRLEPIAHPDAARLEELFTYDLERALLLTNTEQFLAGHPANNVLLYGDRGTGKSSTVKALLQRYPKLKMIELTPDRLADLPELLGRLASSPHRFILFVDDLAFEEFEVQYKHLKAVLEGSLEGRPENVIIYATSNRRHLVKEHFSDLTKPIINDEIHEQDSVQQKLSISDRFGITLTFPSPDQRRYLQIVEGLVRARALPVEAEDLRARAIRWSMYHNGFSGRTARQFVDYLAGEIALGRDRSASLF